MDLPLLTPPVCPGPCQQSHLFSKLCIRSPTPKPSVAPHFLRDTNQCLTGTWSGPCLLSPHPLQSPACCTAAWPLAHALLSSPHCPLCPTCFSLCSGAQGLATQPRDSARLPHPLIHLAVPQVRPTLLELPLLLAATAASTSAAVPGWCLSSCSGVRERFPTILSPGRLTPGRLCVLYSLHKHGECVTCSQFFDKRKPLRVCSGPHGPARGQSRVPPM